MLKVNGILFTAVLLVGRWLGHPTGMQKGIGSTLVRDSIFFILSHHSMES